jgi:hypothetical protein
MSAQTQFVEDQFAMTLDAQQCRLTIGARPVLRNRSELAWKSYIESEENLGDRRSLDYLPCGFRLERHPRGLEAGTRSTF